MQDNSINQQIIDYFLNQFPIKAQDIELVDIFPMIFRQVLEDLDSGNTAVIYPNLPLNKEHIIHKNQAENHNAPLITDGKLVWLNKIYQKERSIANQLQNFLQQKKQNQTDSTTKLKNYLEEKKLNQQQINAILLADSQQFTLINGGPGTGKTHTIGKYLNYLLQNQPNLKIAITAPTGKAAKRLDESLANSLEKNNNFTQSFTLHKLLEFKSNAPPTYNQKNPLLYDVIIVDEASMMSLELAYYLFNAIKKDSKLILLGDANQLAAVDAGAVLHDLTQIPALKNIIATLTESKRFNDNSGIGKLAKAIFTKTTFEEINNIFANNKDINLKQIINIDELISPYQEFIYELKANNPDKIIETFDRYRILTTNHNGKLGRKNLNSYIKQKLTNQPNNNLFYHGAPLMITANDYVNDLFNGDIGICLHNNQEAYLHLKNREPIAISRLNPAILQEAYCLTIHKSQGSEFDNLAIILDESTEQLLSKSMLYTAVTRAKNKLTIYSNKSALIKSLTNNNSRTTGLSSFF